MTTYLFVTPCRWEIGKNYTNFQDEFISIFKIKMSRWTKLKCDYFRFKLTPLFLQMDEEENKTIFKPKCNFI